MENSSGSKYIKDNGLCNGISDISGIYAIVMNDDKVLYVGQAKRMLTRVTTHFEHILKNRVRYKYILLYEAINEGNKIDCVELERCEHNQLNIREEANFDKYKYSNRKYPPLNFLFFKTPGNYSYTTFIGKLNEYALFNKKESELVETAHIDLVDNP